MSSPRWKNFGVRELIGLIPFKQVSHLSFYQLASSSRDCRRRLCSIESSRRFNLRRLPKSVESLDLCHLRQRRMVSYLAITTPSQTLKTLIASGRYQGGHAHSHFDESGHSYVFLAVEALVLSLTSHHTQLCFGDRDRSRVELHRRRMFVSTPSSRLQPS